MSAIPAFLEEIHGLAVKLLVAVCLFFLAAGSHFDLGWPEQAEPGDRSGPNPTTNTAREPVAPTL